MDQALGKRAPRHLLSLAEASGQILSLQAVFSQVILGLGVQVLAW